METENQPQTSQNYQQKAPVSSKIPRTTLVLIGVLVIIVSLTILALFLLSRKKTQAPNVLIPSPTKTTAGVNFKIISTTPENGATDITPGEIPISFTTDVPITSASEFSLSIFPNLPNYWKFTNTYPTTKIVAQVYGTLQKSTRYTLTARNAHNQLVSQWSFTTSSSSAQSSSLLNVERDRQITQQDYPLYKYLPYSSPDFDIGYYQTPRTLEVTPKISNLDMVKQEVNQWIKSHGVDPNTHTIHFTNQ